MTALVTSDSSGELRARRWCVEVVQGPDEGQRVEREGGSVLVGSHADNDLPLSDTTVSRYHLELLLLPEGVMLRDSGSTNGVRIDGVRVQQQLLRPGDTCELGHTTLRVVPVDSPLPTEQTGLERFGDFLTQDPALQGVLAQLQRAAQSKATVLIQGPTGTGKELIARAIHQASPRADGPFVVVDCAAVSATLLESELFGHRKGAFTGADADRPGAFEAAHGGTVFLDELGELSAETQSKLLRVLETRSVRRIGDTEERALDLRFVAATHRDLDRWVEEGRFREDLFYRLAVVRAQLPALGERPLDIAPLAQELARQLGGEQTVFTTAALHALRQYGWPGNVRELRNVVERAVALTSAPSLGPEALFPDQAAQQPVDFHAAKSSMIEQFERRYVSALLEQHDGNISAAARDAGLSRNAFYALMRRAGVGQEER